MNVMSGLEQQILFQSRKETETQHGLDVWYIEKRDRPVQLSTVFVSCTLPTFLFIQFLGGSYHGLPNIVYKGGSLFFLDKQSVVIFSDGMLSCRSGPTGSFQTEPSIGGGLYGARVGNVTDSCTRAFAGGIVSGNHQVAASGEYNTIP